MNNNVKGLAGALVTGIAGIATGYIAGAINNPKPPVYREPEPICGCGHHRSFHDDEGCHASNSNRVLTSRTEPVIEKKPDKEGVSRSKTLIPASESFEPVTIHCGCKSYVGPEPYVSYISGD